MAKLTAGKTFLIGRAGDIFVTAYYMPAIRGKADRIWIAIRQVKAKSKKTKRWEVRENLSYVHGVDILLHKQKETN
jgi:hypothetical protein